MEITSSDRSGRALRHLFGPRFRSKHDLCLAIAVAKIDKDRASVVPVAVHPAAQRDLLSLVGGPKFAARVSTKQVSNPLQ